MPTLQPPKILADAGKALWSEVTSKYELRADELAILQRACRTADLLDVMEAAWAADPRMMVKGSQGQEVINPVLAEMRQYGAALNTLLKSLRLPDENDTAEARSTQARDAANSRWSRRGA